MKIKFSSAISDAKAANINPEIAKELDLLDCEINLCKLADRDDDIAAATQRTLQNYGLSIEEFRATVPEVGMAATVCMYSDSHAATVSRISASGKTLWIRQDIAKVVSGTAHDGSAVYEYTRDDSAPEEKYTRGRGKMNYGQWSDGCTRLSLGNRREYRDPHF
jgi:hypothetical protein